MKHLALLIIALTSTAHATDSQTWQAMEQQRLFQEQQINHNTEMKRKMDDLLRQAENQRTNDYLQQNAESHRQMNQWIRDTLNRKY